MRQILTHRLDGPIALITRGMAAGRASTVPSCSTIYVGNPESNTESAWERWPMPLLARLREC
jgi:hypothetical protein